MPAAILPSVQNSFTGGLKTEFTGLNFPENACTSADNTIFTLIGDVTRREGFDQEVNGTTITRTRLNQAISSYKWNNVGGDGLTQIIVEQVGDTIYFYQSSTATVSSPLSTQQLSSTVNLLSFLASGSSNDPSTIECQYTDGNGYLFIFHPYCDPIYCTYNAGTITGNVITVQIRDLVGIPETGVSVDFRSPTINSEHLYNLENQGWLQGSSWVYNSTSSWGVGLFTGTWTIQTAASGISAGQSVRLDSLSPMITGIMSGTVNSYNSGTGALNITITAYNPAYFNTGPYSNWNIVHLGTTYITNFYTTYASGVYPSNADVWWTFKDSTGAFNPTPTIVNNVDLGTAQAPQGYFILNAFNQTRATVSGISSSTSGFTGGSFGNITNVSTNIRPKTGTWFEGRIWYSGVDAQFPASGDMPYSTWSENIYFSQIVQTPSDFGQCYQQDDPTDENLFNLLPTDGGVIQIQGCGSIYKLFPLKFGLLVFASNGIWFISGSNGTGFSANDYTITKISNIQPISGTSIINVQGYPMFWNEEGIYYVAPSPNGGSAKSPDIALDVTNIALGTILTFYAGIPLQSKKFARGDYNPIDYIVQWCYRDTNESTVTDRYQFNKILNFNTANKAFYTYTLSTGTNYPYIHDIRYVAGPGGSTSPSPVFKYVMSGVSGGTYLFSFAEERTTNYLDWNSWTSGNGLSYNSFFITGYSLKGQAISKFQVPYVYIFSRNPSQNEYIIQSIWDYAGTGNSGRWSTRQIINNNNSNFTMLYRRHRLRGRGLALQIQISSVVGQPFDIMGWALYNSVNQGI